MTDGNGNGKRKRGRPPGTKNGDRPPQLTKWVPKTWEIWMTEAVLLSSKGMSNTELATHFNVTPQHISNITNTPQAALIRREVMDALQERVQTTTVRRLESIASKTVERLDRMVHDDAAFKESPFQIIDRGMKVLEGIGKLQRKDAGKINVDKAIILSGQHSFELLEGMREAEEVKKLYEAEPAEIVYEPTD